MTATEIQQGWDRRLFTVTVQDGTGDTFTLGYYTFNKSDIPELVAREAAQFLAAHPAQVEQAALTILAIHPARSRLKAAPPP